MACEYEIIQIKKTIESENGEIEEMKEMAAYQSAAKRNKI